MGIARRARWLAGVVLVWGCTRHPGAQHAPAAPPSPADWLQARGNLGEWGEDPAKVPGFALRQERRAPKMPDAAAAMADLPARSVARVDDALLICLTEIYSRNGQEPLFYHYKLGPPDAGRPRLDRDWDQFGGPDALVQVRLRDDPPIMLFGPEDHWGFYFSVPQVRLVRGERFAVRLWDRDSAADASVEQGQFIGEDAVTFDGRLPFSLHGAYFAMRCQVMDHAEAARRAAPILARVDAALDAGELAAVESPYGKDSLRYAAGYLGWPDPAIQQRLARIRSLNPR